jgi:hypothetical protein
MEMTKIEMEFVGNPNELSDKTVEALIELNSLELLLVGGGAGDVHFSVTP